jgi:ribosomal protein L11 methyltransferase
LNQRESDSCSSGAGDQKRIFAVVDEITAQRASAALETELEDDGYPIAAFETDSASGTWNISVYVPEQAFEPALARVQAILSAIGLKLDIGVENLGKVDWVSRSLQGLGAVRAGRFVVAGKHAVSSIGPNDRGIVIEAAEAFGTGHHGTTAGCLEMLDLCFRRRRYLNALDLGTGSGVLAMAMAKTQPLRVLASDIDPLAVRIARQNASINGVAGRIEFRAANGLADRRITQRQPFDLVCANILAGPLAGMARDLSRSLCGGATLILSGLLPHQRARIVAAYRPHGLRLVRSHSRDGWLTLVFEKTYRQLKGD